MGSIIDLGPMSEEDEFRMDLSRKFPSSPLAEMLKETKDDEVRSVLLDQLYDQTLGKLQSGMDNRSLRQMPQSPFNNYFPQGRLSSPKYKTGLMEHFERLIQEGLLFKDKDI